jgi:hypothetical protein
MLKLTSHLLVVAAVIGAAPAAAHPPTCPAPPNRVQAVVNVGVVFDPVAALYTYRYRVQNLNASAFPIDHFAVDFASPPGVSGAEAPAGWADLVSRTRSTMEWMALAVAPLAPDAVDTGAIPHSVAEIQPGQAVEGFVFESPLPPGPVNYYVLGFRDAPVAQSEAEAEWIADNCRDATAGFFELAVVGSTFGPVRRR